jgi:hypothetical protein
MSNNQDRTYYEIIYTPECEKRSRKMFEKIKKNIKNKIKKEEEIPEENEFSKARDIANKYSQLEQCCSILASTKPINLDSHGMNYMYLSQGWRVWESSLKRAGIDVEEIYQYIEKLTIKRKLEIELELSKI